jgi:hypothetical protein
LLSFPSRIEGWSTTSATRWYFGHTVLDSKWKVGDSITTWVRFAHANISGATTGWHTHIELRRMYDGVWQSVRYVTRSKERKLDEKRMSWVGWSAFNPYSKAAGIPEISTPWPYYFTHYDLGDKNQNDSTPCIWASGKDLCYLERTWVRTMALTKDIREKMWVQFGDKVRLEWDAWCSWIFQVEDEMNIRFRKTPGILRPGTKFYIKWDLPSMDGWACNVTKL